MLLCAFATSAQAQIYASDAGQHDGPLILSNHLSAATPVLLIDQSAPTTTTIVSSPPALAPMTPASARVPSAVVDRLIPRIALEFAISESLVRAVIAVESGFDPKARSRKGAMGLMQLMPDTARRFGVVDPFSEEQNLRGGIAYLRWLLDTFAGDVSLALAAYNAGEAAVLRAGRRIPNYAETKAYVPKVMAYQRRYAQARAASPASR